MSQPIAPVTQTDSITAEEYMAHYAARFYEWVKGELIAPMPTSQQHNNILMYLLQLLNAYFALNKIGVVRIQPFVMRVDSTDSRREPDLQVILHINPGQLTETAMVGAADICIEIVSPESMGRDHGQKFEEYEASGVREYWIIDPVRDEARFYRLNDNGIYTPVKPDTSGMYQTPLLPRLQVSVATLWLDELPDFFAIGEAVKGMFAE